MYAPHLTIHVWKLTYTEVNSRACSYISSSPSKNLPKHFFLRSGSLWKVQNEQHWNTPSAFLVLFFFSIESRESNQVMAVHIHIHRCALAPTKEDGLQKLCIPLLVQVVILIFVLLAPILPAPAPSSLSSTFWCFYLLNSIQTGTWSSLSNQ